MKTYVTIIICCLIHVAVYSQQMFTGKVTDQATGLPIPYVNVYTGIGENGTITNEEGEFDLLVPVDTDQIFISHLLYHGQTINISPQSKTNLAITLKAVESYDLPKVEISANYAEGLVARLREAYTKREAPSYLHQGFYRQTSRTGAKHNEIIEFFVKNVSSIHGISSWKIEESRYAFYKGDLTFRYTNFSFLSKGIKLFSNPEKADESSSIRIPLMKGYEELYDIKLKKFIPHANGEGHLAVIQFTSKVGTAHPILEGDMYIDPDQLNIYAFKGSIAHHLGAVWKTDHSASKNHRYTVDISYRYNPTFDYMLIDHINMKYTADIYQEEQKLEDLEVNSIFFNYDTKSEKKRILFSKVKSHHDDLDKASRKKYDADFWKANTIVKRTPIQDEVIAAFEARKFFGNYFQ